MRDFAMYTEAGNEIVADMVDAVLGLHRPTDKEIYNFLKHRMNKIAEDYPEVWDTDVREHVIDHIERKLDRQLSIYF